MQSLKIISPNGHLGFAPIRTESFALGVAARPRLHRGRFGQRRRRARCRSAPTSAPARKTGSATTLKHMLLASRKLGVPMIIGSSGDTGSNSRVDLFVRIIRELAAQHGLKKFRLGYFYSEVDREYLRGKCAPATPCWDSTGARR